MEEEIKPKSEHEKIMNKRLYDIEVEIADFIKNHEGKEPECIILNPQTIEEVLNHYIDAESVKAINWKEPVGFAFADGTVELRIFRTVDLPYGQYFIR